MPKVSTALQLHVAFDDIIRQLANCNDKYRFSTRPYIVLPEFTVEIEVMITSHFEVAKELHIRCTSFSKVPKRVDVITDELDVP